MSPRTGRRPGESGARAEILAAARASFTENGYDGATIRDVASRASVDPALIHHYFKNKQSLFAATVQVPFDPTEIVERVLSGTRGSLGNAIAHAFLEVWDGQAGHSPMVALMRSATTNEDAARMFREFLTTEVLGRVARRLEVEQAPVRAALVGSQLMGLALMRYVIPIEPLASAPREELADLIAPTIQRYLTGDIRPRTES
jgi:AcrR family transcriptional regulator